MHSKNVHTCSAKLLHLNEMQHGMCCKPLHPCMSSNLLVFCRKPSVAASTMCSACMVQLQMGVRRQGRSTRHYMRLHFTPVRKLVRIARFDALMAEYGRNIQLPEEDLMSSWTAHCNMTVADLRPETKAAVYERPGRMHPCTCVPFLLRVHVFCLALLCSIEG